MNARLSDFRRSPLSLLTMLVALANAQIPCTPVGGSYGLDAVCGGKSYSISKLINTAASTPFCTQGIAISGTLYYFCVNVVNNGLPQPFHFSAGGSSYTCSIPNTGGIGYFTVMQVGASSTTCWGAGHNPAVSMMFNPATDQLIVSYTGGTNNRSSRLLIGCKGATSYSPSIFSAAQSGTASYDISMLSLAGCGSGGNGGDAAASGVGGDVFLGLLFGGFGLYFVIGAVYQWKVKAATRSDLIIHKEFWISILSLIKEGCRFSLSIVTRSEYQRL